jgi:hypothetical protein
MELYLGDRFKTSDVSKALGQIGFYIKEVEGST